MFLPITTIAVAILAIWTVILGLRVVGSRRESKVALGSGGDEMLERRMRAQTNLAEYAPFGLLALLCAEAQAAGTLMHWLIGLTAAAFVAGRLMHGYAMAFTTGHPTFRYWGTVLTLVTILALAALALIGLALRSFY